MSTTTEKKVKQEDIVLNYLKEKDGRKITTDRAMKITKSKSRASMNYLLPKMASDGLISRIDTGTYTLPGKVKTTTPSKTIPASKKSSKMDVIDVTEIRSKLIAKKQEHLSSVESIDKEIKKLDTFEKHASNVVKSAASVL